MVTHILLTGANGYLGSYVCRELLRQCYKVIGFTYSHFRSRIVNHPDVTYLECDIRSDVASNVAVLDALEGKDVTAIVNTAALLGSSDYEQNYQVNARGVKNLVNLAVRKGVERFVHISTVCVLKPIKGPYGETKLAGQEFLVNSKLSYTIFIPAMILGPESLGLNRILKSAFWLPLVVPLIGDGSQMQHPIFVEDLAKCIVKCIDRPQSHGMIYEIGGDTVLSFRDLLGMILALKGKRRICVNVPPFLAKALGHVFQKTQKVPRFTAEHVKGVLQDSRLNTVAVRKDLDFDPTPLETALKRCLDVIGSNWDLYLQPKPMETIIQSWSRD